MHPNFPKDELYKKCSIVFSIAGTAGFEAACYGKPAITLIDLNYSLLPSVSKLENFEDLNDMIQKKILEKVNPDDVNKFLNLFENNVSNFDWTSFSKKLFDEFFSGNIQDAEISEEKMQSFLDKNYDMIEIFADDHINKIKWLNEQYKK